MFKETFGAGINQIVNEMVNNKLDGMRVTEDETLAQFHMGTILEATPGTLISGDEIADIMEESKRTGVPMAILFRRLKNVSITTTVEPGPAVIEKAARTSRRRGKAKNINSIGEEREQSYRKPFKSTTVRYEYSP